MGFRFRKIFSFGKGFRNLSKGGKLTSAISTVLVIVIVCLCCLCMSIVLLIGSENPKQPTSTPAARSIPIEELIAMTANEAQLQTQVFYTPTQPPPMPVGTSTFTPTVTMVYVNPTSTIFIFMLQTNVVQPTEYHATHTPFVLATPPPSSLGGNCDPHYVGVCINGNPRLNCEQLRKQGIFHFKVLQPDPLGYDKDKDGIGCE